MDSPREVSFVVLAVPVAQPRQRHGVRVTGTGEAKSFNYSDKKHPIFEYKLQVQMAARAALDGGPPLCGPLHLGLSFILPRPKSLCRKKDPPGRIPCDKKLGDCDNLAKAIMDVGNKLLYADDSQISSLFVTKEYAAKNEEPHVVVLLQEIGNG